MIQRNESLRSVIHVAATVSVVAAIVCWVAVAVQYLETRGNVDYQCLVEGYGPGIAVGEDALIEARVSAFPVGRVCIWRAIDGLGTVETASDWTLTVVALMGAALLVICGPILIWHFRNVLAALPLVAGLAAWGLILLRTVG